MASRSGTTGRTPRLPSGCARGGAGAAASRWLRLLSWVWVLPWVVGTARGEVPQAPARGAGGATEGGADPFLGSVAKRLASGDYAGAARRLSRAAPGPRATLLRARLALVTGNYAEAESQAARAISEGADDPVQAQCLRAQALRAQGAGDRAEPVLRRALLASAHAGPNLQPGTVCVRFVLGSLFMERGGRAGAMRQFRALLADQRRICAGGRCVHSASRTEARPGLSGAEQEALLRHAALASVALGRSQEAHGLFAAAMAAAPTAETLAAWAGTFLDNDERRKAHEFLEAALSFNPNHPGALELRARLQLRAAADLTSAKEDLQRALAVNPNLVPAHVTRAAVALRELDHGLAERALERALAIDPTDLRALTMRAVARYLASDPQGQAVAEQQVLQRNPRYAELYLTVARFAEWQHRHRDQVALARKALAVDPENRHAHAVLGINLLRLGEEDEGRRALRIAGRRDPDNRRVLHLLALYREVIDTDYVTLTTGPFVLRVSREARVMLEPYLAPLLLQAYTRMSGRYGIAPEGPLRVELFDTERDFAVRTTGLPGVGVQGVCFGKVITAVSPRAAAFNWGQILWHELSHVFHLQLSDNRVPRWFTEGLAEHETGLARPEWRREEDRTLWLAYRRDRVPELSELHLFFTRAYTQERLMTAYYTATLAVQFLIDRFGFPKMVQMLSAWGEGRSTSEVLSGVLRVPPATLDREFRGYLRRRLSRFSREFRLEPQAPGGIGALLKRRVSLPADADAAADLALALVGEGKFRRGERHALAALALVPDHPRAQFALSRVALERGDPAEAARRIAAIVRGGHDSPWLRRMLAYAAKAEGRLDDAVSQVYAAIALDPQDVAAHRLLLELAAERSDRALARSALLAIARLDQHDRMAYRLLLEALADAGDYDALIQVGEAALYVDPASPGVHQHLAEGYAGRGQDAAALQEYDQVLRLSPEWAAPAHFGRARALLALGRLPEARLALSTALALEPTLVTRLRRTAPELKLLLPRPGALGEPAVGGPKETGPAAPEPGEP